MNESQMPIVAVSVGSTNIRHAVCTGAEPGEQHVIRAEDPIAAADGIGDKILDWERENESSIEAIVVATVNRPASDRLVEALRRVVTEPIIQLGSELPIPIARTSALDPGTGQDRLLNGLAAFHLVQQACAVVDVGTAVTVDFVDGEGSFQGGVIAPGARTMLRQLADSTTSLPAIDLAPLGSDPFPKTTADAMLAGAHLGVRGLVRSCVERFAEAYDAYPMIIATGGDASAILGTDELIERLVPDLTLRGIAISYMRQVAFDDADDE